MKVLAAGELRLGLEGCAGGMLFMGEALLFLRVLVFRHTRGFKREVVERLLCVCV